ncbi:hypothetical protein DM01DRAFT_1332241 [Hesseltinella vesiculosa]|uniref:K Homology domain-containing protein n=1 Tax=Hesseltinella vesiculosa TaxID=101127 RepID=A0A1X2GUE1_9FUNG|nr:hypothetical protein DM01DRAFT_1332241 [Hesseltinella vesiculosa]
MSQNTDQLIDDRFSETNAFGSRQDEDDGLLTLRALVSTKEAGVIIGKAGKNVAELRDATGVKAGVSKVVQGIHDRVLTITGTLEGVAKAYSLMAQTLLENPITPGSSPASPLPVRVSPDAMVTIRLLISHNLMGTVIGRQGAKIKYIQDTSGVRMTASKALLPQSTERVVEVRGTVEGIRLAMLEISRCLIEDKDRAFGTILYNPSKASVLQQPALNGNGNPMPLTDRRASLPRTGNGSDFTQQANGHRASRSSTNAPLLADDPNIRTQHISIPSDMVGCIIGKAGSKISEIRRLSGSRISIAKVPHDETGERMFTIQGTAEANERALYLLYGQLESEKERRLQGVIQEDLTEEDQAQQD